MGKVTHIKHNGLGSNKVLITHTDLDGIGCAVVFLKCYPQASVFFADYAYVDELVMEVLEEFPEADIMISDISVNPKVAEYLNGRGNVALLDHHRTAEWLNEYEWATVVQGKCGTRLVYELLSAWFNIQDLEEFVNLVESWDLWGNGTYPSEESIEYQFLFDFMGRKDFLSEVIKDLNFPMNPEWAWLLDKLLEKYEAYYEVTKGITQVHMNGEYRVGITIADQHTSLMGHRLCEDLDLEYVMMLDNRKGTGSLRGKGNIDLGALAKAAGGGGHRRAAGFPLGTSARDLVGQIEGNG